MKNFTSFLSSMPKSVLKTSCFLLSIDGFLFKKAGSPFLYEEDLEDKNDALLKTLEFQTLEGLTNRYKEAARHGIRISAGNNYNDVFKGMSEDGQLLKIQSELIKRDIRQDSSISEKEDEYFNDVVKLAFINLEELAFLDHQPKMVFKAEIPNEIEDMQGATKLADSIINSDESHNELALASKMIFQDEKIIEDYKEYINSMHSLLSIAEKYPDLKTTIEDLINKKKVPISKLHDTIDVIYRHIKETKDQKWKDLRSLKLFMENIMPGAEIGIEDEQGLPEDAAVKSNLEKVLELTIRNHKDCYKMILEDKNYSKEKESSEIPGWTAHPYLIFYIAVSGLGYLISLGSYLV